MTVKRREFITLLGGAAAWPLAAHAQQGNRVRRIGVLMNGIATDSRLQSNLATFVQGLGQLGWNEGQNVRIDVRWSAGDGDLARTYAAQLIGLMPDVILSLTTTNLKVVRGSHQHRASRVCGRLRSRCAGLRRQYGQAGRQPHRIYPV
jgi:putative ABC transport system substrate-binding protein